MELRGKEKRVGFSEGTDPLVAYIELFQSFIYVKGVINQKSGHKLSSLLISVES